MHWVGVLVDDPRGQKVPGNAEHACLSLLPPVRCSVCAHAWWVNGRVAPEGAPKGCIEGWVKTAAEGRREEARREVREAVRRGERGCSPSHLPVQSTECARWVGRFHPWRDGERAARRTHTHARVRVHTHTDLCRSGRRDIDSPMSRGSPARSSSRVGPGTAQAPRCPRRSSCRPDMPGPEGWPPPVRSRSREVTCTGPCPPSRRRKSSRVRMEIHLAWCWRLGNNCLLQLGMAPCLPSPHCNRIQSGTLFRQGSWSWRGRRAQRQRCRPPYPLVPPDTSSPPDRQCQRGC